MKGTQEQIGTADETRVYTIREIALLTKSSVSTVYQRIRAGDLPVRKLGGKTIILHEELVAWLRGLPVKPAMSASHSDRMRAEWRRRREGEAAR